MTPNIAHAFLRTAQRLPQKPFLVETSGEVLTYRQVLQRSLRFASHLRRHGVQAEDRVVLTFPNSTDLLCAYIGGMFAGATVLLVDARSRLQHVEYVYADSGATLWVTAEGRPEYGDVAESMIFCRDEVDALTPLSIDEAGRHENPLALIMYTSGSTGRPKGVCLSHENLWHTVNSITSWAEITSAERELTTLSLSHLFGLAHCHVHWTLGNTVYIGETLRDVPRLLETVAREKITSLPGTPGGFKLILDQYGEQFREQAASLKYVIVNSAPMPEEYVRRMLEALPQTRVYMYYGLTEASRSTYICYNDHPTKLRTVGRPTPGSSVCVGDPNAPLVGRTGEVLIKGPHVARGYWGVNGGDLFVDGWFKTGDLGSIDRDGFLTWEGRLIEQINIDGLKVSPMEVEAFLSEHARVRDCAVLGAPDPMTGESVVAFVVPDGPADEGLGLQLRRFCKTGLEVFKIPKRVVFVDEIPRTDTGKTKRFALRERFLGE